MDNYLLLGKWFHSDRLYNPYTKRKIKKNKKTYNRLLKLINEYIKNDKYYYILNRINRICPLSFEKVDRGFIVKNIWNSFIGKFNKIEDPFGSLVFDCDYLIYYFYSNRLKYIYTHGTINTTGYLGDAIGKYPLFNIPGRGNHPEWYLFRLPINDCYIDNKVIKYVTMGPELSRDDIINIYNISINNNTYELKFNHKIPNIIELYDLYHLVINKCPYEIDNSIIEVLGNEYITQLKMDYYMPYINNIINF